jgi:2-polyprenyl-3-methyl-5-hydroxy-6-metoxy-1,4-benzoquinol methylase
LSKIDQIRTYWNNRPCNIRHSAQPVGSQSYFNEVELRKYLVEPHILDFAEFRLWENKKVLEIGCGIGTDTISFARAGAGVTAVDLSDKSLAVAAHRAHVFKKNVKFYQANAEELTKVVPTEPYDLIYSFGVIHHTVRPEEVLKQIKSYVKPGTTIKIMVYNRLSWKVLWILFKYGYGQFWKLPELIARYSEAETGCPVTYTYTKKSITKLLEKHGFKVRYAEVDHIFPYDIGEYKQYRYKKVWYFRWIPELWFRKLEKMLGWHLMVTATS